MPRRPVNLSIDPDALERARRYADRHTTSLSQLVTEYFAALPAEGDEREASYPPAVLRLIGILPGDTDVEQYRRHLLEKYGS